ncbi:MAG: pentapeptide repeat-containing protein, partial [Cyanobacteria bacterium P01_E01_bin.43]
LFGTNLTNANLRNVSLEEAKLSYTIMPNGYCLVGENDVDADPNHSQVSLSNIAAYSRLSQKFKKF